VTSASEHERVAATESGHLSAPNDHAAEPKEIETNVACTNVPKPIMTVADALAALHSAAIGKGEARVLRRALLAALAALETEE
jgi:hypothetical protein